MAIDENKIKNRAEVGGKGIGKLAPLLRFKKSQTKGGRMFDAVRVSLGIVIIAAMIFGTAMLLYTLMSEGSEAVYSIQKKQQMEKEAESQKHPEFHQVILKPKQTKE